jgi:hypothetical protein
MSTRIQRANMRRYWTLIKTFHTKRIVFKVCTRDITWFYWNWKSNLYSFEKLSTARRLNPDADVEIEYKLRVGLRGDMSRGDVARQVPEINPCV